MAFYALPCVNLLCMDVAAAGFTLQKASNIKLAASSHGVRTIAQTYLITVLVLLLPVTPTTLSRFLSMCYQQLWKSLFSIRRFAMIATLHSSPVPWSVGAVRGRSNGRRFTSTHASPTAEFVLETNIYNPRFQRVLRQRNWLDGWGFRSPLAWPIWGLLYFCNCNLSQCPPMISIRSHPENLVESSTSWSETKDL